MTMTAVEKVKRRLWTYQYKVTDMTEHKFIHAYDLVVEGIYRVAVCERLSERCFALQIDVLAFVEKGKITFYKNPYLHEGKGRVCGEVVDTSPLKIFIKHERTKKHTRGIILRRKTTGTAKGRRGDNSAK